MAGLDPVKALEMLQSGEYSDFTITCRGKEFKVHKMMICCESDFFKKCCEGNFKVGVLLLLLLLTIKHVSAGIVLMFF